MKKTDEEIIKRFAKADFDPEGTKEARVFNKITAQKQKSFRVNWAFASVAAVILIAGVIIGNYSDKLFSSEENNIICSVIEESDSTVYMATNPQPVKLNVAQKPIVGEDGDLTEEDCVEINTKYLLAQAAKQQSVFLAKTKDCPNKEGISVYDSKIIAVLEKEMKEYSKDIFSEKDMHKLKACTDKYHPKVHPFVIYRMEC